MGYDLITTIERIGFNNEKFIFIAHADNYAAYEIHFESGLKILVPHFVCTDSEKLMMFLTEKANKFNNIQKVNEYLGVK